MLSGKYSEPDSMKMSVDHLLERSTRCIPGSANSHEANRRDHSKPTLDLDPSKRHTQNGETLG